VDTEVDVRYVMSGNARLAFRVRTGGPHPIVTVPNWVSNQDPDLLESERAHSVFFERLSSFATVVSYDQRGTAPVPGLEGRGRVRRRAAQAGRHRGLARSIGRFSAVGSG
jgi:hypothetical protein